MVEKVVRKIQRVTGKVRRLFVRGGVILAYHRVADPASDPHRLAVSPARFARHVEHLTKTCALMPLQELFNALREDRLPKRAVAITFDDAYLDVFEQARPILRAARAPATLFAPAGLIGVEREFWHDELDAIFHCPGALPESLQLRIRGESRSWKTVSQGNRNGAFWDIWGLIKPFPHEERSLVLDELNAWAGRAPMCREGYRPMNANELRELSREGWEIGAHTITHPVLSAITADEQRREIAGGRSMLADLLGRGVSSFAYPHGSASDFTDETAAIVKEAGFDLACTMVPGSVEAGDDPFRLKRWAVLDWPVDVFAKELESFYAL